MNNNDISQNNIYENDSEDPLDSPYDKPFELPDFDWNKSILARYREVDLDFFRNFVLFDPKGKGFMIKVDSTNELYMNDDYFFDALTEIDENNPEHPHATSDGQPDESYRNANKPNEELVSLLSKKYSINFESADHAKSNAFNAGNWHPSPDINVLSGAKILLNYGEGILDFIYADFLLPKMRTLFRKPIPYSESGIYEGEPRLLEGEAKKAAKTFYEYKWLFENLHEVIYSSLYSAICPPRFDHTKTFYKEVLYYVGYLEHLQTEYQNLIQFCYDASFYPEVLGSLHPAERCAIYRDARNMPPVSTREETVVIGSLSGIVNGKMPFGISVAEHSRRFHLFAQSKPNEKTIELAEKLKVDPTKLTVESTLPRFLNISYQFSSVDQILEFEFTKMLEHDIRFKRCKRCGRYFILKGNYDPSYCDRIDSWETKTCRELATAENYKAKIADNKAFAEYNKYYKRYAARVKVRQIKEPDFKKWKYQALSKRDECTDGSLSLEDYVEWLESSFPNRKPRKPKE